jgi:hypothetical protein
MCSSTAFTTFYRGVLGWDAAVERRDAQDELHSAAQARAWADGDFNADHGFAFDGVPPPPHWGELPTPPLPQGRGRSPPALTLALALTPMGSTIRRSAQRQQQHQQHRQHRLPPRETLPGRWLKTAEVRDREMKPD